MHRLATFIVGVVVLVVLLVMTGWFDSVVVVAAKRENSRTFNLDPLLLVRSVGFVLTAGATLLVAVAGWRLRSIGLGIAYTLVGAFFTFLDAITWKLAAQINDAPPVLPEPVARAVNLFYPWEQGPLGATQIVGAGTLLVGIAVVASVLLGRVPPGVHAKERSSTRLAPEAGAPAGGAS